MKNTLKAWRRLQRDARALFAQVFLGWALKMDATEVMETVVGGVIDAERRTGSLPGAWARQRGLTDASEWTVWDAPEPAWPPQYPEKPR